MSLWAAGARISALADCHAVHNFDGRETRFCRESVRSLAVSSDRRIAQPQLRKRLPQGWQRSQTQSGTAPLCNVAEQWTSIMDSRQGDGLTRRPHGESCARCRTRARGGMHASSFCPPPCPAKLEVPLTTLPRLTEGHRQPLYCGAFNHIAHQLGDLLATVGGNRVRSACCCYCNATSAQLGDTPLASVMLAG
jgi:hypothetical protein